MADTDQQLEDVRKKIQAAEAEKTAALAKGDTSYAAALVAQITSLQNKEIFLMQLQQTQGEQICAMHGEIVTSQKEILDLSRDNQPSPMHTHLDFHRYVLFHLF